MKRIFSLLLAGFVVVLMFGGTGNTALAAPKEKVEDCGCKSGFSISEKNKIVSDLLTSDNFKNTKILAETLGFKWRGADQIDLAKNDVNGLIYIMVPFYNTDGTIEVFLFINGQYFVNFPYDL